MRLSFTKSVFWRATVYGLAGFVCVFSLGLLLVLPAKATTGINEQLNYQARLLNSSGAVVADGTYNMEFKVYQDGDGVVGGGDETLKWTETRTGGNKVTVTNGYFSVQLGAVTAFASNIDWNQDTLWLSLNIGGTGTPTWDGEMSPFRRLAASSYALNAKQLGGLDWSKFVQIAPSAVQTDTSALSTLFLNKNNASGNILQLQKSGSDVVVVSNSGLTTFNTDVDFVLASTENIGISSDLAGTVNMLSLVGTPSSSAGTTRGIFLQQANHASNTNSLDVGIYIDNADADLAMQAAISIQASGGAPAPFTNILDILGTGLSASELTVLDGGLTESEISGEIEAVTAGNGLTGGGIADSVTLDIASGNGGIVVNANDITLDASVSGDGLSSTTSNGSGLEVVATGLTLLQGCGDAQVLQWSESSDVWSCATLSGGGGGYATVQDEASNLTQRTTLNFTGGGIACADNSGSSRTDCTVGFISSDGAGVTSSASGLEAGTGGFGLLQGCSDDQVLKWNEGGSVWECGSDRATFQNRLDGDYTNTTTTFTDVDNNSDAADDLGFAVGSNETWIFQMNMQFASNTTADAKWQITAPSGATCDVSVSHAEEAISVSNIACGASSGSIAVATTATDQVWISGTVTTAGTSGAVQLQHGQVAASLTSTVFAGSYVLAYKVSGADLAEIYYTKEQGGQPPGTLVSLDPAFEAGVERSKMSYDPRLLGIVSTRPGQVLGEAQPDGQGSPVVVALVGRVPVRVSAENGPIQPGDYLTSSSTPGVAMKATKSGFVIAQALTGFAGSGEGLVAGFIKPIWYNVPQPTGVDLQNGSLDALAVRRLDVNELAVTGDAMFAGKVAVKDMQIYGHLTVGKDAAGTAVIPAGQTHAYVAFERPYDTPPKVTVGASDFVPVKVDNRTTAGFRLSIPAIRQQDISIDWLAVALKED